MAKNLIPEIARMLGVKIGEEFKIKGYGELICTITDDKGLMAADDSSETGWIPANALFAVLLNGKAEIIKLPWKPKVGEEYYTFIAKGTDNPCLHVCCEKWNERLDDWAMFKAGWIYRTKEEVQAVLPYVANLLGLKYEL